MAVLETVHKVMGRRFIFAVETSDSGDDYLKYEKMRKDIWEDPDDHLAGSRNLVSENFLYDGGSLFIAVYEEGRAGSLSRDPERLAAFAYGYVGVVDKAVAFRDPKNLVFYSQYAAVRPDLQAGGLGILLKEFQREQVRGRLGVQVMTCTFDPLVGVNAYRNIHVFGMEVRAYKDTYYKGFAGRLNRVDVPCDRFLVAWDLGKPRREEQQAIDVPVLLREGADLMLTEPARVRGKHGELDLRVAKGLRSEATLEQVLIEIPYDFYTMLQETDVEDAQVRQIPITWRELSRRAFHDRLDAGYRVVDFLYLEDKQGKRDFYVLSKTNIE
jgi:predicted GNAT superfamily acetyltransferase